MLWFFVAVAFAHPLHTHIIAGCVKDTVNPAQIGVLVPNPSTNDGLSLGGGGPLVYFAGHGDDAPYGSLLHATRATLDNAKKYGVRPYALVEYHTDCGVGGSTWGVTMTRWQRIDGTARAPLDVPTVITALHARILATVAADPAWSARLDAQRPELGVAGVVQPDELSEWPTWEDDHLVVRFEVERDEVVGGGCPGMPVRSRDECNLTTAVSSVTGRFTATVDSTGKSVDMHAEPLAGSVIHVPPAQ